MFQKASRIKLRFLTCVGNLSVEDVWDLPLIASGNKISLDSLAQDLYKKVKESGENSFVIKKNKINTILDLQFSIVKHIIEVKLTEADDNEKKTTVEAQKKQILEIIADKKQDSLKNKSIEELQEMLKE